MAVSKSTSSKTSTSLKTSAPTKTEPDKDDHVPSTLMKKATFAEDGSNYNEVLDLVKIAEPFAIARRNQYATVDAILWNGGAVRRGATVELHKGRRLRVIQKVKG